MQKQRSNVEPLRRPRRGRQRRIDSSDYHELFIEVAQTCAVVGDLDELLNRIVNTVGPGLNVARCMIGLYPANSRGYTFQYVYRAPDAPDTGQLVMVGYNENPSFQMLVCGEIYCCHDTASDPRFVALRHFYSTHHIGATLFAGLQRNDEWLGSLGLHQCDGPRQWGGAEVAILRLIADQVALAIDLIRFRERAQQQKENLAHQSRELKLLKSFQEPMLSHSWNDEFEETNTPRSSTAISDAEYRVLRLVAKGRTNAEIAGALNLSRRTVESHITSMLSKLELRNRVELARFALRQKIA